MGCHCVFEWMIREIIDGGVGSGSFPVNANFNVGCVHGYGLV